MVERVISNHLGNSFAYMWTIFFGGKDVWVMGNIIILDSVKYKQYRWYGSQVLHAGTYPPSSEGMYFDLEIGDDNRHVSFNAKEWCGSVHITLHATAYNLFPASVFSQYCLISISNIWIYWWFSLVVNGLRYARTNMILIPFHGKFP